MFAKNPQFEYVFHNHKRLVVQNDGLDGRVLCRRCLHDVLETGNWIPRFANRFKSEECQQWMYEHWRSNKCEITGKNVTSYKDVAIPPFVDAMFCTTSWNGSYISKKAVLRCVKDGKIKTHTRNNKGQSLNHKGFALDDEGKLL